MAPHFEHLLHRVKQGLSTIELVHIPHDRWPLPRLHSPATPSPSCRLRISVLDSSFNPPTLAHHALARTRTVDTEGADFDARLLLLSVRNADKSLKPGDATYTQRLEMMILLARGISASSSPPLSTPSAGDDGNVAVAIIDEPTFVGKSRILCDFLRARLASLDAAVTVTEVPSPELTFVVGLDTLERILAVRYYRDEEHMRSALHDFLSPSRDNSRLLCARRAIPGSLESASEYERRVVELAQRTIDPQRLAIVDIGETVEAYSSSEVRERIARSDSLWEEMVLPEVAHYIKAQRLYLGSDTQTNVQM